jgi:cytochrome c biogenesis protein CcmG/thiol:disulfide interchange protein DsbE
VKRVLILVPLLIFAALVVVLGLGLTLNPTAVPSPLIGKPAPAFAVPSLHEPDQVVSSEDLKGRVSVVNVWASWCVACRDEHPYIMQLAQLNKAPVIGLNYKDERSAGNNWLNRFGDAYTVSAYDPDGKVGLDWGVYGVPETFIVDREGVVRHKHIGPIDARSLREDIIPWIERLQAEKP